MATAKNLKAVVKTTPTVKNSKQAMVIILIFLSVVLFTAITIIWLKPKPKSGQKQSKQSEITIPSTYTEYHTLKESKIIRVNIPNGYKCDYYGGGKKYYHQAQNSKKEIWGGGNCPTGLGNPNASYADLSYYNEEITVMCKFKRKF